MLRPITTSETCTGAVPKHKACICRFAMVEVISSVRIRIRNCKEEVLRSDQKSVLQNNHQIYYIYKYFQFFMLIVASIRYHSQSFISDRLSFSFRVSETSIVETSGTNTETL